MVILGEAPGAEEVECGKPFVRKAGRKLFQILEEETGLTRNGRLSKSLLGAPEKRRGGRRTIGTSIDVAGVSGDAFDDG